MFEYKSLTMLATSEVCLGGEDVWVSVIGIELKQLSGALA